MVTVRQSRGTRAAGLLGLVLAAGIATPSARAADAKTTWSLRFDLDERYDDNIIQLSDRDITRLENPTATQATRDAASNRFSIGAPGDFVTIPRFSSGFRRTWGSDRPTSFDFDGSFYRYRDNAIKNYESYRLAVFQPLHRGRYATTIRLSYGLIPSFYLRNLVSDIAVEEGFVPLVPGQPVRRLEATYKRATRQIEVSQSIVTGRLWIDGIAGNEERNFEHFFNQRDSRNPFYEIGPIWAPLSGGRLRLTASFRRENLHAHGSAGDPFVHDDVSSRRDILSGSVRVRWGRKGRRQSFSLDYENEKRVYVTTDVNDAFHFDRTDRRRYTTLSYRAELKRSLFLLAQAERDSNRSHFSAATGLASDPSDTTDYDESLYTIGVGYSFGAGERDKGTEGPDRP